MTQIPKIDIHRSRRSRSFRVTERLWQDDFKRLIGLISQHVENLKNHYEDSDRSDLDSAPNLSLAIFSPPGSGKSSFLKTLVEETRKNRGQDDSLKKVASLDILQPARFGEGDHLVYATIAAGLDAHHKKRGEGLDYEVLTPVLRAYRDLSDHLRVLREEPPITELEPNALAAEVIQRHTSGLKLGEKIAKFIDKLADDLAGDSQNRSDRSSVVLLPVDDLDLSPRHLRPGLRELQAYLLHPRLVPVFCFTDRLAEEILGGEFAKIVTHADTRRRQSGRLSVSEQLAVQYLSKCFPIRNRLRLGPIPATLQGGNLNNDNPKDDREEPVLWTLVTASLLLFGVPDRAARHPVRAALRPSTLRRQFHVIDAMRQAEVDSLISERLIALQKPPCKECTLKERVPAATWGVLFDRAAWALMNVHRDVFREYGMHLEDLYSWTPHGLRRVLLDSLFQQPGKAQVGLWQRWQSLTDSRRSQIISLLAVNAFRPWLAGERPSGEDLPQIAIARDEKIQETFQWCECKIYCKRDKSESENRRCNKKEEVIEAPVALQWFLDLAIGFYLPLGRSVFRHLRAEKYSKESLSGAGWSFHSAPIHAAQAADDDRKLFPTGMMFLDPFSYAAALTTAPRIAACRVLDDETIEDSEWDLIKKAKVEILSHRTSAVVEKEFELSTAKSKEGIGRAIEAYRETARWEIGDEKNGLLSKSGISQKDLKEQLKAHAYDKATETIDKSKLSDKTKKGIKAKISGLAEAAATVHDDQLLLRIWTCYGYNRGRFWAAASLWRGLGLMGQLIESHRRWRMEWFGEHDKSPASMSEQELEEFLCASEYRKHIIEKIAGELHTHSLRGIVPGKDLGGPAHKGTLELAFSGWNTPGQRQAIWRLSTRLQSWLDHNWSLEVKPLQEDPRPRWNQCFTRRLHGGYIVGSLWQWLDAEFLEHQGRQYGQRRNYYWSAGVALTSWIRVLQRYFGGSHEIRWMIETCPLTAPCLSRSQRDPFLAKLREKPYAETLQSVAKDGEACALRDLQSRKMRVAERFRAITSRLQTLWVEGADLESLGRLCDIEGPRENSDRNSWNEAANNILASLMEKEPKGKENTPWKEFFETDDKDYGYDRIVEVAQKAREAVWGPRGLSSKKDSYRESLLQTYRPRVLVRQHDGDEGKEDRDILDPTSACFEIASLIQQHWKGTAHASASSLFYQIPRVRRVDFFDQEQTKDARNVEVSGQLSVTKQTGDRDSDSAGESGKKP